MSKNEAMKKLEEIYTKEGMEAVVLKIARLLQFAPDRYMNDPVQAVVSGIDTVESLPQHTTYNKIKEWYGDGKDYDTFSFDCLGSFVHNVSKLLYPSETTLTEDELFSAIHALGEKEGIQYATGYLAVNYLGCARQNFCGYMMGAYKLMKAIDGRTKIRMHSLKNIRTTYITSTNKTEFLRKVGETLLSPEVLVYEPVA